MPGLTVVASLPMERGRGVAQPIFLVLTGDQAVLDALSADLDRRFGADYRVLGASSAAAALRMLEEAANAAESVALIFADQRLTEMAAVDFLGRGRTLHRAAMANLEQPEAGSLDQPEMTSAVTRLPGIFLRPTLPGGAQSAS